MTHRKYKSQHLLVIQGVITFHVTNMCLLNLGRMTCYSVVELHKKSVKHYITGKELCPSSFIYAPTIILSHKLVLAKNNLSTACSYTSLKSISGKKYPFTC